MVSGLPWGLALSSGVNTYLPLFLLALFARFGHVIHVSSRFTWLVSDQAILILGLLALCEILAQKFPVLDNLWDFLHTLLRPMAGAVAAGATLSTNNAFEIAVAMLMGGTLAAAAHSTKSSLRLMSTSKSFGAANFALSLVEDAGAPENLLKPRGRGIFIMRSMMDRVTFDFSGGGTVCHLVKNRRNGSPLDEPDADVLPDESD